VEFLEPNLNIFSVHDTPPNPTKKILKARQRRGVVRNGKRDYTNNV
jgi:hypothetical protein